MPEALYFEMWPVVICKIVCYNYYEAGRITVIGERGAQMNNHEARIILEKLFEGVHPVTGEVFVEDHVCNDPQVMRALHRAIAVLNAQPIAAEAAKTARQNHENSKKPWTQEEDVYLRNACQQEIPLEEICAELRRSGQSVRYRLIYLGLADRSILGDSRYPETGHDHQGLPWYPEEDERLTALYRDGHKPKALSAAMKRSVNSIMCRLEKLGLIESRYEYTAPNTSR